MIPASEEKIPNYPEFEYKNLVAKLKTAKDTIISKDELFTAMCDSTTTSDSKFEPKSFYLLNYQESEELDIAHMDEKGIDKLIDDPNTHWKFHISLNDEETGNIEKGWDVLKNILTKHLVGLSKVVIPNIILADFNQAGKQITIYTWHNKDFNVSKWKEILREITEAFVKADVLPGYKCLGSKDKPEHEMTGSSYFTCRFEFPKGRDGITLFTEVPPCPYAEINLSDIEQPLSQEKQTCCIIL